MKKISIMIMISLMIALFAVGSYAADKMTGAQVFKASDLIGANVKNAQGESLGSISDLAINPQGSIVFAVISHGLAGKLIPVPINALTLEEKGKIVRLDVTNEKIESAPYFTSPNWPDMSTQKMTEDTNRFYGISPSWKESEPMEKDRDMMEKKDKYNH